ncbi:MAG: XrtA/PEP-CTERM system exopolysaccharide export protein [Pseudomonadota bacterium]
MNLQFAQSSGIGSDLTEGTPPPDYKIGPGDTMSILVQSRPDLSAGAVVRPDGRLTIPLIEDLEVAGLTATELADTLEEKLSVYVVDPTVTVVITGFAGLFSEQVRVVGEVVQPQGMPYRSGMTLLDVMVATGGLSPYADGNNAKIIRRQGDSTTEIPVRLNDLVDQGNTSANIAMAPGDILVIPEGFFAGEWFVTKRVRWRETFTDNVNLEPDGDPALITTISPGISAFVNAAKFRAGFDAAVPIRYQAINDEEFEVNVDLAATSNTELVENRAFLDANASVSQQTLNNEDATSVSPDNLTNLDTVVTLFASPYVVGNYEDIATWEARYSVGTFFTNDSGTSNAVTNRLALTANGGTMFSRLNWLTLLAGSYNYRPDAEDVTRGDALLQLDYAVLRSLILIGSVGYQFFDDGDLSNEIDEPTWRAGFRWNPSPDLELEATYGRSDGEDNLFAGLFYAVTPSTILTASYQEFLTTSQGLLINDLSFAGLNDDGGIIDTRTGNEFDPNGQPFSINDETTRRKVLVADVVTHVGRNTFSVFGGLEKEENLDSDTDEDIQFAGARWSRSLTPDLNMRIRGGWRRTDFDDTIEGRVDNTYDAIGELVYRIAQNLSGRVSYGFGLRDSTDPDDEYTENVVTIGLTATF